MSASAGDPESRTPQVPIVFTGAARWVAAALLVIGPLLQSPANAHQRHASDPKG